MTKSIKQKSKTRRWQIFICQEHATITIKQQKLRSIVRRIINSLDWNRLPANVNSVNLLFTSNKQITELNRTYRRKNKATDVLSFLYSSFASSFKSSLLGDIVISLDQAKKQARQFKVSLDEEVLRLVVHGLLHLAGYEHEKVERKIANQMWQKQDQLIVELGSYVAGLTKIDITKS